MTLAAPLLPQTNPQDGKPTESPPTAEEKRILKLIEKWSLMPQISVADVEGIYDDLLSAGRVAAKLKSDRIVQAIVDFPVHDPDVGEAKMWALIHFINKKNPAAHACVVEALQNPEPKIQKTAATVLSRWGEWELAVPIIHKYGNYEALGYGKTYFRDPRLIPILQEGARSSTWEGRTKAAYYLRYFGDSTTIVEVARDVMAHAPNVDDRSIARAKYTALRSLARGHVTDNIPDIARLANDASSLVRYQVVDILQIYAYNGIEEAYQALKKIAEENADPDTRESAKAALQTIDKKK